MDREVTIERIVDSNEVRLTGENSFVRLSPNDGEEPTTHASHWRIALSPLGPGHALFIRSELFNGQVRVYTDQKDLTRWLQKEIESTMHPGFDDITLPLNEATFSKRGDLMSSWVEEIVTSDSTLVLQWSDFIEPYMVHAKPNPPQRPHGIYSLLIPARKSKVKVNNAYAKGNALKMEQNGKDSSGCCVALSETWVRPN